MEEVIRVGDRIFQDPLHPKTYVFVDTSGYNDDGDELDETAYYTPIPPSLANGFVIVGPDKSGVLHLYDENYVEIGQTFIQQKNNTEVFLPENARYIWFTFDAMQNEEARALSQKSINNFESFLGGKTQ